MIDYWAHAHVDDPNLARQEHFETEGFEAEVAALEAQETITPANEAAWDVVAEETYGDGA